MTRSLIKDATRKATRVCVERTATDDFGELPARKATAIRLANLSRGHQMGPWKRRKNSVCNVSDCFCVDCNMGLAVALEPLHPGEPVIWGPASTTDCDNVTLSLRLRA